MATNLIRNGSFSRQGKYWKTYSWYSGNTIDFQENGGQTGSCVKLSVPSTGNPGQSSVFQFIPMVTGNTYTLTFYAKRTDSVDVWVEVLANGAYVFSPSFIPQLVSGGDYVKLTYQFTVPGTGTNITLARVRFIAGSAGGTAWFDTAEIQSEKVFLSSKYIEIGSNVTVFKNAEVSDNNYGILPEGAKFIFDGIVNNMVAINWGRTDGMTTNAYIRIADSWCSEVSIENFAMDRMITIASYLVGSAGANLGLEGNYCENFVHWLSGACGLSTDVYCGSGFCGPAVKHYIQEEIYEVRGTPKYGVYPGDLAYYDVTGYGTDNITSAHVGFVISTSGDTYTTIEGNVTVAGKTIVARVTGSISNGTNTIHSRVLHGVAHIFGVG